MDTLTAPSYLNSISADPTLSRQLRAGDREALKKLSLTFEQIYAQAEDEAGDETLLYPFSCAVSCEPSPSRLPPI